MSDIQYYGTGRRKTAAARVFLRPGAGGIQVNGRDFEEFFASKVLRMIVRQPLLLTETADKFDIHMTISGGGPAGQAGAARHGISRALLAFNGELRWRKQADAALGEGFLAYEAAIRDTIGLRGQPRLPEEQALYVAAYNSHHRDVSLNF